VVPTCCSSEVEWILQSFDLLKGIENKTSYLVKHSERQEGNQIIESNLERRIS
jgi:hypothetical protein